MGRKPGKKKVVQGDSGNQGHGSGGIDNTNIGGSSSRTRPLLSRRQKEKQPMNNTVARRGVPINVGASGSGNARQPLEMNAVENNYYDGEIDEEDDDEYEDEEFVEDSVSEDFTSTASVGSRDEEYPELAYDEDSDDTDCEYPYDLNEIRKSTSLKVPTIIKEKIIETIMDSGASCSVISRHLPKLKLLPNGDTLAISGVDSKKKYGSEERNVSDITTSVPVRIG